MESVGIQDEFLTSETAEHLVSTPQAVSNTNSSLPPRFNNRKNRSEVWDHFSEPNSDKKAKCNYCGSTIKCDQGTSSMRTHLKRCKDHPDRDQNKRIKSALSSIGATEGHVGSSLSAVARFDQQVCRDALVKMLVATELPFRFIENEDFRWFINIVSPKFNLTSRTTMARDALTLYQVEKVKLKRFLAMQCTRVCLTTDTWTSCQNLCYMCLTAHFVDKNWKLHKKILNFCQVKSHSGEVMAKTVLSCLNDWGLNRVFSLTVDNASSNDTGIQNLKKSLMLQSNLVLKGDHIHMRCFAHILNLIVKEGLKDMDDSILRIRAAVKYIRSSPSRFEKFKACAEKQKIEYKGAPILDVETRWNSTYLMLEAALKHERAFEQLELQDKNYYHELEKGKGVPTYEDWYYAQLILPFLKIFYRVTLTVSGTSYVTSNRYMIEVFKIGKKIRQMCESNDSSVSEMAQRMKKKYDKYWGNPENLNMLLLIAVVLDPRCKMSFLHWSIKDSFNSGEAAGLREKLEYCLKSIFEEYSSKEGVSQDNSQETQFDDDDDDDFVNHFQQTTGHKSNAKSELKKYLDEAIENYSDFDILTWWKANSSRFPILASIAREVLAIPVSTVASESAFSTGGRVLDPYRSRLTAKTVEALVCTQDWVKRTPFLEHSNEDLEELEKIEEEMVSQQDATCSTSVALDID